jgi:hypothetical protein
MGFDKVKNKRKVKKVSRGRAIRCAGKVVEKVDAIISLATIIPCAADLAKRDFSSIHPYIIGTRQHVAQSVGKNAVATLTVRAATAAASNSKKTNSTHTTTKESNSSNSNSNKSSNHTNNSSNNNDSNSNNDNISNNNNE